MKDPTVGAIRNRLMAVWRYFLPYDKRKILSI